MQTNADEVVVVADNNLLQLQMNVDKDPLVDDYDYL